MLVSMRSSLLAEECRPECAICRLCTQRPPRLHAWSHLVSGQLERCPQNPIAALVIIQTHAHCRVTTGRNARRRIGPGVAVGVRVGCTAAVV